MLKSCEESFSHPRNTAQGAECYVVILDLVLAPGLSCPICKIESTPLCLDSSGKMEIKRGSEGGGQSLALGLGRILRSHCCWLYDLDEGCHLTEPQVPYL